MTSQTISGKVSSSAASKHVFEGNEVLKVSIVDASLADAPSIQLGNQNITIQQGQSFPIPFEFSYDKSRARGDGNGLLVEARITDKNYRLIFINDTRTRAVDNVTVDVIQV